MDHWTPLDLVLVPEASPDGPPEPLRVADVAEALAARRVLATVLDAERVGVEGGVVARLALHDGRVVVTDGDDDALPGPSEGEVVLGLAHRVGAVVSIDGLVVGSDNLVRDDTALATVRPSVRRRTVTAWRGDDDLLLASMTAAELGGGGDRGAGGDGGGGSALVVDGWAVTAWDTETPIPETVLPLPRRHHPLVLATRSGDLRSLVLTPAPGADSLEATWVPPMSRVVTVRPGSPADTVLADLEVTVSPDGDDDWPVGFDPALRTHLVAAQRGPGEAFLADVTRLLWLPPVVASLTESPAGPGQPDPPGTRRVGGSSALRVGWDHVRTSSPETRGERRIRAWPRWRAVLQVIGSLVVAALCLAVPQVLELRFVPAWFFWGAAALAAFDAAMTVWLRRGGPRPDG